MSPAIDLDRKTQLARKLGAEINLDAKEEDVSARSQKKIEALTAHW